MGIKIAIVRTDYVRLFNGSLVAQHNDVVVLDIVPGLSSLSDSSNDVDRTLGFSDAR